MAFLEFDRFYSRRGSLHAWSLHVSRDILPFKTKDDRAVQGANISFETVVTILIFEFKSLEKRQRKARHWKLEAETVARVVRIPNDGAKETGNRTQDDKYVTFALFCFTIPPATNVGLVCSSARFLTAT